MTNAQKQRIESIKRRIPKFDFYGHPEKYEIKDFTVEELDWTDDLFVHFETGMKGDEGTLAAIYCRKRRVFWIGARGGIRTYIGKRRKAIYVTEFELMNWHYKTN